MMRRIESVFFSVEFPNIFLAIQIAISPFRTGNGFSKRTKGARIYQRDEISKPLWRSTIEVKSDV